MPIYSKQILEFLKNPDELDIKKEDKIAVICPVDLSLIDLLHEDFDNIFLITENKLLIEQVTEKYRNIKVKTGNEQRTGLDDNSIDNIFIEKTELKTDLNKIRIEFKRILRNYYSDLIYIENTNALLKNENNSFEIIEKLFAGSWFEKTEFEFDSDNRKIKTIIYWNPPGFDEEELRSQTILEFVKACENYCEIFENFTVYGVKDFLFEIQKSLTDCYYKALFLPESCRSDRNDLSAHDIKMSKDKINFHIRFNELIKFFGKHDMYWSNFDPYPDEGEEKETYDHSLALDLAEIYEDIKSNLIVFKTGNLYDKQDTLWQWKFDWRGHTGDHTTFAFRAIHWKLQDLEFEDD